ncbi:hypothetical protein B566_EDAN015256 [Ephemera danica]|nr:hypothetical protein B566_EDAN015256 [Ephemera danica]
MENTCLFCGEPLGSVLSHKVTAKGLNTIKNISIERKDGVSDRISEANCIFVHENCRKKYIRLRVSDSHGDPSSVVTCVPKLTRSRVPAFNPKEQCIFCGEDVMNKNRKRNKAIRICATKQIKHEILHKIKERNDEWGMKVQLRIEGVIGDLIAGDGRYHAHCHTIFYTGASLGSRKKTGRPPNIENSIAFNKLRTFIDSSGECQFSLSELFNFFTQQNGNLSRVHFRNELNRIYGKRIVFSQSCSKRTIVSLKEMTNQSLSDRWKSAKLANDSEMNSVVIDTAIAIIRKEISEMVQDNTIYDLGSGNIEEYNEIVPPSLKKLLDGIITGKRSNENSQKKCTFISHAILSATRPRSFISPLLLTLGVKLHRLYGSRQLVDIMSALGCSESYHEIHKFEASAVMREEQVIPQGEHTVQYVYDNADHNAATIDGSGSFHVLGGIECVTPKSVNSSVFRIKRLTSPSWNGFMQSAMEGINSLSYNETSINALSFIHGAPSSPHTIYTALVEARKRCDSHGQTICIFTGDLPTYATAREIVSNSPENEKLKNIVVRIGGFHLLMNFLGAIGYIMTASGIEELLCTIYARGSVDSMMTAKYYSRSLRGHMLIHAALGKIIFSTIRLEDITKNEIFKCFTMFRNNELGVEDFILSDIPRKLLTSVSEKLSSICAYGPTSKLWVQYFELINLVKMYIRSERTGDWELHLSTIVSMIPIFYASGHFKYAKYAQIYIQDMHDLKNKMPEVEYLRFTQGEFTIRRNPWYWSGCWSDLIIEQELMRSLKSSGGITRGRGITESTVEQFISSLPACLEAIAVIEKFSDMRTEYSEQHKEMRDARIERDKKDIDKLYHWLLVRNPFNEFQKHLISLNTGVVAQTTVNCHMARELAVAQIDKLIGMEIAEIKFQRKNRVVNLAAAASSITIHDEKVCIDPALLFSRMICLNPTQADMKYYFSFELAPRAPALFDKENFMRKSNKSVLAAELKKK